MQKGRLAAITLLSMGSLEPLGYGKVPLQISLSQNPLPTHQLASEARLPASKGYSREGRAPALRKALERIS